MAMPQLIDIKSPVAESRTTYKYTVSGQKLETRYRWNSNYSPLPEIGSEVNVSALNRQKLKQYIGNKIYENGVLDMTLLPNGYYKHSDNNYYFYTRDYQGNNVVVANGTGQLKQRTYYYPFGQPMNESTGLDFQSFKYNAKELDSESGLNLYDYHARQQDPVLGRFTTMDPLAEKFASMSPYSAMGNNPIFYIEPDGREIIGVTKKDAQNFKSDIHLTLADKKFDGVRALIDVKGSTFKSIDTKALGTALDGVTLSADERAYVDMVTNTINSTDVHKIEYLSGANTSSEGATAFKDHMNSVQAGAGDAMVPSGQLSSALITGLGGAGFNVPTKKGSHSFISSGVQGNERASTSGHEVFGHGIPSARGLSPSDNNANAIRTDNLIRRMLGMPQRDGKDHGGYKEGHITDPQKLSIIQ